MEMQDCMKLKIEGCGGWDGGRIDWISFFYISLHICFYSSCGMYIISLLFLVAYYYCYRRWIVFLFFIPSCSEETTLAFTSTSLDAQLISFHKIAVKVYFLKISIRGSTKEISLVLGGINKILFTDLEENKGTFTPSMKWTGLPWPFLSTANKMSLSYLRVWWKWVYCQKLGGKVTYKFRISVLSMI